MFSTTRKQALFVQRAAGSESSDCHKEGGRQETLQQSTGDEATLASLISRLSAMF